MKGRLFMAGMGFCLVLLASPARAGGLFQRAPSSSDTGSCCPEQPSSAQAPIMPGADEMLRPEGFPTNFPPGMMGQAPGAPGTGAQPTETGTAAPSTFAPGLFGDLALPFPAIVRVPPGLAPRDIIFASPTSTLPLAIVFPRQILILTTNPNPRTVTFMGPFVLGPHFIIAPNLVPRPTAPVAAPPVQPTPALVSTLPFHTSFKAAENESPRPTDRAYVTYNYYSDVLASGSAASVPNFSSAVIHREVAGIEKTFLDGNASIGVRIPFFQVFGGGPVIDGETKLGDSQIGDVSLIFKYAFYLDKETGNVFSGGMVLTMPSGPALPIPGESDLNSTVFQPWLGGIYNGENWFVQSFTSLAVPTDARDVTLFFESIGMGYWLYRSNDRDAKLRGIIPDAEFHANIPLNHHNLESTPVGFPYNVDFTGGCYFLFKKFSIGLAASTPITGPRPYGFEALANLNYRW
jgi:hypothetical protein